MKSLQNIHPIVFILIATIFEVSGDAIVRLGICKHSGLIRIGFMMLGGILLLAYGSFLNLAPLEFGQIAGLYIATLFIVWQVINFIAFKQQPTLPVLLGGALIVTGGLIVTFLKS